MNVLEGCYDEAIIIDSKGSKHTVRGCRIARWTCNPFNIFQKYRTVLVDLDLEQAGNLSLPDLKIYLLDSIMINRWKSWEGQSKKDKICQINDPATIEDLIAKIDVFSE